MPRSCLEAVCALLRRDTRPGPTASAGIDFLMDLLFFGDFRIFEQVTSVADRDVVNLVGIKGEGEAPLWLVAPLGTGRDPVAARWAATGGDPLNPTLDESNQRLHGLGAASGKVDLALKLLAASRIPADALRRPLGVVALCGEEGSRSGVEELLAPHGAGVGSALVGAPTNLRLVVDHPGCAVWQLSLDRQVRYRRMPPTRGIYDLTIEAPSAHAEAPREGGDALKRTWTLLDQLRERGDVRILSLAAGEGPYRVPARCGLRIACSFDTLGDLPADVTARPVPDGTSVPFPVGELVDLWRAAAAAGADAVTGGSNEADATWHTATLQTEPHRIVGTVAVRGRPGTSWAQHESAFARAAGEAAQLHEDVSVDVMAVGARPSLVDRGGPWEMLPVAQEALERLGLDAAPSSGRLTTDAGHLAEHGIRSLVFGPGDGITDSYRDDESVPFAQLEAALAFYERFIRTWCG